MNDPQIKLYVAPGTCSIVSMIALEEAELRFETVLLRFMKREHKTQEYLKIHPLGQVPAIEIDGVVLITNIAILDFLAERFPAANLLPVADTPIKRAARLADLSFCDSILHPIVPRIRLPFYFADGELAAQSVQRKAVVAMEGYFTYVEQRVRGGAWWYGDAWSVIDGYLYWVWRRVAEAGFPTDGFPALMRHAHRMEDRASVKRARARELQQFITLQNEGVPDAPSILSISMRSCDH